MPTQPDAFLSYTRVDDEFFGGAITALRKFLELGVRVVTGNQDFNIFQDIDGIEFGQQWQKQLDQAIANTRFLIPIMTPLFFQSKACRDELGKFVEHEQSVGRDDLILPIYFVTTPLLEKPELLLEDSLASEVNARQRYDWRSQADLPITDPRTRKAVRELSEKIGAAIFSTPTGVPRIAPNERTRDFDLENASRNIQNQQVKKGLGKEKSPRRILWVDDRPNNNITERKALEAYNITFDLAKSTGEALALLRNNHFDAINK